MSARNSNTTAMEKVTSGDFSAGGTLAPEQFEDFMEDVQEQSDILSQARSVPVSAPSGDIPRISVGTELLSQVDENSSVSEVGFNQPDVPFQTTKVSLPWSMTWEANNEIIDSPESTIRRLFVQQFAADLERLASKGDTTGSGFSAIEDGWLKIAADRSAPTYDHTGGAVNDELFDSTLDALAEKYRKAQEDQLVFLTSYANKQSYKDFLTDRSTGAGDAMLMTGEEPTPYGHRIVTPLGFPDDQVMLTTMSNLLYIVQDDLRVKQTESSERNVMQDVDTLYNMLAKIDFQIMDEDGVVVANNVGTA
jgi:hypothetical protein